jgi:nitrogen-specific signal transduction histidine kinase/CheY-like chemotaxis protein
MEERKLLERQLSQAQKMQAIGTLAGGVAHDFNNLLSAIRGYSELAVMIPEKDAELDNCLQQIQKACSRAEDLVKQILAFARQADQNRRPIKVRRIAEEVMVLLRSTIPSSIRIESTLESESMVLADPTQVHQIFLNLGSNAAQAMESDGGVLKLTLDDVTISAQQAREYVDLSPGDYIRIALSDMGIGIPEAHMDTIFEPYFTTKPVGGGTGLGLSVVHGIVKGLQGEIMVASQPGQGTCFTVYLPVTSESEPVAAAEDDTLPRGSGHILVVDDEEAVADMVGQTLRRCGYTVSVYTDSEAALTFFRGRPTVIDAIVTDMTMPQMNGDVLAHKSKTIRPDVPVLLCTGYSSKLAGKTAAEIGVEALCLKPLTGKNLLTTLRAVLDQSRLH